MQTKVRTVVVLVAVAFLGVICYLVATSSKSVSNDNMSPPSKDFSNWSKNWENQR